MLRLTLWALIKLRGTLHERDGEVDGMEVCHGDQAMEWYERYPACVVEGRVLHQEIHQHTPRVCLGQEMYPAWQKLHKKIWVQ